jgi:competence protein CoiA
MPLRCVDPAANTNVLAFDLSVEAWRILERENRRTRHLRMPCCAAQVTLKISRRGTQFFAHKDIGACRTGPETENHLCLKRLAVEAARAHGWEATTEVVGETPAGEPWKADVLARKGSRKVAIEIQWSAQSNDETLRRQYCYAQSEVRCLWLFRHGGFPVSQELPAARVGGGVGEGFTAFVPTGEGFQVLPIPEFLEAAFSRRLRFGFPCGIRARVAIRAGALDCWHQSCGKRTRIITAIDVAFGPHERSFSVARLGEFSGLFELIRPQLPDNLGLGTIKRRFSRTLGHSYLSNGCAHCDRLIGDFFGHDAWDTAETVCEFPICLSDQWRGAVEADERGIAWGIYEPHAFDGIA